ncbi:YgiT-type zinc finger protein [bacterium]|nr:YgiT-type zinc finger protein [bacterium]OIO89000.1 MAG: YgiT-type zinc finger domain-containing protein [Anaerolineae bacterium CG2_30_58_95]PJH74825.1 MAG: YgiT-type zinc finger domain-containing protein [Anaerolineae bacterium CG_4_9_14_0_8_um_filter_58_9]
MFQFHVCGSNKAHQELINEVFQIDGEPVLVENIPAQVCDHCGEEVFASGTVEKVRLLVHGKSNPLKSVKMNVFAYA